MAKVSEKIHMLEMFRLHPEEYLPIVDHAWRVFPKVNEGTEWYDDPEYNLGWNTGLLNGNRPYFLERWATCGITILTYFISTIGLENATEEELVKLLTDAHLFRLTDPGNMSVEAKKFKDRNGNEFFSINVTESFEDETYVEGVKSFPYRSLNEYNSRNKEEPHEES